MSRELKSGVVLNYIAIVLNLASGLLLTPRIISQLGMSEYGLFMLSNSIIVWLGLTDFGLGATTTRYVVLYRAQGQQQRQAHLLGQATLLFTLLGVAALAAGVVIYFHLHLLFPTLDTRQLHLLHLLYIITLSNFVLSFPLRPLAAMPGAYRRFLAPGLAGLVQAVLNILLTLYLLRLGMKAVGLSLLALALNLALMLWLLRYALCRLGVRVVFRRPDWKLYRRIFAFSFWVMLNQLMDLLYWQLGGPIVGRICGPQSVAVYTLGISFARYFMTASTAISGVLTPELMHRVAQGHSRQELTEMMVRVGRVQLFVLLIGLSLFCIFGLDFLRLWVGSSTGGNTSTIWLGALLIVIPLLIPLTQNCGIAILQALNLHRGRAVILLLTAACCVVPGYLLTLRFGAVGMFCSTAAALTLGHGVLLNLYFAHRVRLSMGYFYRRTYLPALLPLLLSLLLGAGVRLSFPISDWESLLLSAACCAPAAALLFYFLYLGSGERAYFNTLLRR